jgi:hypothetical protein
MEVIRVESRRNVCFSGRLAAHCPYRSVGRCFFASVQAQAQQARMSYVFETKHGASLATERPRSP